MIHPQPVNVSEPSLENFEWVGFGKLNVPAAQLRFGFQLDIAPKAPFPQIVFGFVERDSHAGALGRGFAVRIDLDRGEIWDIANGSGLVGWIEHPLGMAAFDEEEPMLLSWEIERIGSVLIPKLQVGGEEWLYPSIRCVEALRMSAIAGSDTSDVNPHDLFMHPALWGEEHPSASVGVCHED